MTYTCTIAHCTEPIRAKNLCARHYFTEHKRRYRRRFSDRARADSDLTRCTCGAWAWLHEPCEECGLPEVREPYISGLTSRGVA